MRARASARILEKEVQYNLIEEVEKHRGAGGSWKDHSQAWAQTHRKKQCNASLEEVLAAMYVHTYLRLPP